MADPTVPEGFYRRPQGRLPYDVSSFTPRSSIKKDADCRRAGSS
jgi:hypothetical protein